MRRLVIGGLIALKLMLLFALAWNRLFIMDEFVQLGWAKYLGREMFDSLWPGKSVGFHLFIKPAHLLGWDAQSILLIGRTQTALLACGTLVILYASARRLDQSKLCSALVVLTCLSFSNFIERVIETRAEPLALFFGAGALLVSLGRNEARGPILAAGLLSGLAFLATQKAIYFNVALGLALVANSVFRRRFAEGFERGALLVLGWCAAVAIYCFAFGGTQPLPILSHLFFGPSAVMAPEVAAAYDTFGYYRMQTLTRNALLYLLCFSGMIMAVLRVRQLAEPNVIALIFSAVITAFVFAHDQPWPYVFVMALPFLSLWVGVPLDRLRSRPVYGAASVAVFAVGIIASFGWNIRALQIDNRDQLAVVRAAEQLTGTRDFYFDGVSMLPNRSEPSTLWLDRITIQRTLREGQASEAYRILATQPAKVILWSYRMDQIRPLIWPLVRNSYAHIGPNIWVAGRSLKRGQATVFDVPISGTYALYDTTGRRVSGHVQAGNGFAGPQIELVRGSRTIILRDGPRQAYLLPVGNYEGVVKPREDYDLFAGIYS